eukprot:g15897.t1
MLDGLYMPTTWCNSASSTVRGKPLITTDLEGSEIRAGSGGARGGLRESLRSSLLGRRPRLRLRLRLRVRRRSSLDRLALLREE